MAGCTIRSISGSVWSEPPCFDWDRIEERRLPDNNPWLEKLRAFTRALVARADERCPVVQPLLRGPVDIVAAMLGDQETTLAFYDHPDEMATLLDICTDIFLRAASARLDLTPEFHGGYLSSYGIWAPGKTVRTQTDNAVLLSPNLYKERLLPYERRIMEAFEYSLIHLHSGVVHIVADALVEVEGLNAIQVSADYPDIAAETAIVDAFTQWLVQRPEWYDVVVTTNMFGDIVTDLASVLQGGMGMAVGCNTGDEHAMFEPIHGSAPKHAGKSRANPFAMILAVGEGLSWYGRRVGHEGLAGASRLVEQAIGDQLVAGEVLTYDLVGEEAASTTVAVGDAIAARLADLI